MASRSIRTKPARARARWAEWSQLAVKVPELAALLDQVRRAVRAGRPGHRIWYAGGRGISNVRARIKLVLRRTARSGQTLPPNAELIAVDRLVAELLYAQNFEDW